MVFDGWEYGVSGGTYFGPSARSWPTAVWRRDAATLSEAFHKRHPTKFPISSFAATVDNPRHQPAATVKMVSFAVILK